MKQRISVIIPVYNGARFIRDALASVCTQTYLPAEVVVADDCSTDRTGEVVLEFARTAPVPITLFRMERNTGGPYRPASQAFQRTTGDYVCILDADDMFAPEAFGTYLSMFEADPNANVGLATSDFTTFRDGTGETVVPSYFATQPALGRVLDDSSSGVLLDRNEAIRIYAETFAIPFKGMLRREAWAAMEGPNLNYRHACDVEFIWRLIANSDFLVRLINRPLVRVRISPTSMSSNHVLESGELVAVFRQMLATVQDASLRRTINRRLERELFDLAYASYKKRAIKVFVPAVWDLAMARVRRCVLRPANQP